MATTEYLRMTFECAATGDQWGDTIGALFDCAEFLYFNGYDVPEEWEFSPSPLRGEEFPPEFGGFGLLAGFETPAGIRSELDRFAAEVTAFGENMNLRAGRLRAQGREY